MPMHTQPQPTPTNAPAAPLPPRFVDHLIDILTATVPSVTSAPPTDKAELQEFLRLVFVAMQPRNPVEAFLAVQAIAAWYAGMNLYARAARPGLSDDTARRLRATAIGASRSFDAAVRARVVRQPKPHADASQAPGTPAPRPSAPAPKHARSARPMLDPRLTPGMHPVPAHPADACLTLEQALVSMLHKQTPRAALQSSVAMPAVA